LIANAARPGLLVICYTTVQLVIANFPARCAQPAPTVYVVFTVAAGKRANVYHTPGVLLSDKMKLSVIPASWFASWSTSARPDTSSP